MLEPSTSSGVASAPEDRRLHDRVTGPFDGCRIELLETPVRIYDLSLGGCFVNCAHEQAAGVQVELKIHLPYEGWITVKGETLYGRAGFGFAVQFTDIEGEQRRCLERALHRLSVRKLTKM
jgi:hypothetical protein